MNFLKKLFSPTFLTISLLLLFYTFYRSEITYSGDKRNYYLTYYILSFLLIFFSIVTFFISYKIKEYMIIISFSLLISLYLFEGYLTVDLNDKYQLYEKETGKKWDKRLPYEIYDDLRKENNEIVITARATLHENKNNPIFSIAGISNSKTIHCNENGYYSIYQSDRYGFNNPDIEWDSNQIEFLLVGDSYTHGSCVNRPNDIGSVLRTLSNKSVLNLGYRGNGPLVEYITLREYLTPKVKKVLWIFSANDLYNLENEMNAEILKNYLNDISFTQNLRLKQKEIDTNLKIFLKSYEERLKKLEKKSILKEFIKIYNIRNLILKKEEEAAAASTEEFKKVIRLAKDLTKKNNSKLYFVYLPGYARYVNKVDINKTYISVKNITEELGIPFIDIHKEVFENKENLLDFFPFEQNGHYNINGYSKVGQTIYNFAKD
tara:strand:- start:2338 stop:3636 length:1299 start_codon:yes stop_codon:yes gene_type:complete